MNLTNQAVIKQLEPSDFPCAEEVIRASFATVAADLGLTEQNCPKYVGFVTTTERLQTHNDWGWLMYGLYEGNQLFGHISISKSREKDGEYEIHNVAVLPEYRHMGFGKQLLDFSKAKVNELNGIKITAGIIEENTVLKNWYAANGFVHTGTKRFDHLPFTVGFMEWEVGKRMEWDAQKYHATCGRVTEHGVKLVNVLQALSCNRVLDLGCGTGVLTNDIAGFAREVIGIDASPAMIEQAKASYPGLEFHVMDACSLTWVDYFDAVFSNAVFHFIKAQDFLLDGIYKALTKNGVLVCEFGVSGNIAGLLDAVATACTKRRKDYSLRFYYPTQDEYGSLLEKHGFFVESIITYDLDTQLIEGAVGLRNWINQIFRVEMEWFDSTEREAVLDEIDAVLSPAQWDGSNWHLPNRRIQVIARK